MKKRLGAEGYRYDRLIAEGGFGSLYKLLETGRGRGTHVLKCSHLEELA